MIAPEARQLEHLQRRLSDVRIRLHYLAGRREDRLLFDYQNAIARELGLQDRPTRRASEQLMQTVYRTANAVRQLNTVVHQNVVARVFPQQAEAPVALNERFLVRNELLEAATEDLFEREPRARTRNRRAVARSSIPASCPRRRAAAARRSATRSSSSASRTATPVPDLPVTTAQASR